jgi:hypothetical protein
VGHPRWGSVCTNRPGLNPLAPLRYAIGCRLSVGLSDDSRMGFPAPPADDHNGNYIQRVTAWVHDVVDGGRGPVREVDSVFYVSGHAEPKAPELILLVDGTRIDCVDGTVIDGADMRRYEQAYARAYGQSPALRTEDGKQLRFHQWWPPASATENRVAASSEATRLFPKPRPIGEPRTLG